jgi:type II secretory pathway component PulJ
MKLSTSSNNIAGSTLGELMIGLGLSSLIAAAAITASVALQKSFNAVDNFFATQMQQIRIVDYLSRDVQRGLAVTTSVDLQSVTVNLPNYLVQPGDAEAVADPNSIGTPRTPTVSYSLSGAQVNYTSAPTTVVYQVNGLSIVRIENGVVTTIASSTDQLVPQTTDVELTNTEYTTSTVTFQPVFTSNGVAAERTGTTLCSTAYLRNKRRG